jgi:hypothetical protein
VTVTVGPEHEQAQIVMHSAARTDLVTQSDTVRQRLQRLLTGLLQDATALIPSPKPPPKAGAKK